MDGIVSYIVQAVAGLIGGNAAGAAAKNVSLGPVGNSITGALGGLGGGQILAALAPSLSGAADAAAGSGGFDIGALVAQVAGGGVGGAVLTAIVGWVKKTFMSKA